MVGKQVPKLHRNLCKQDLDWPFRRWLKVMLKNHTLFFQPELKVKMNLLLFITQQIFLKVHSSCSHSSSALKTKEIVGQAQQRVFFYLIKEPHSSKTSSVLAIHFPEVLTESYWYDPRQLVEGHKFGNHTSPTHIILSAHLWVKSCPSSPGTWRGGSAALLWNHSSLKPL